MANMYPSKLAGGGGGTAVLQETTLWTNSNPPGSMRSFTATLSQSISNFDYIKIKAAPSRDYSSAEYCVDSIFPVADIRKSLAQTQGGGYVPQLYVGGFEDLYYLVRRVNYKSDTQLDFSSAQSAGSSGGGTSYSIPIISIVGLTLTTQ